MLNSLLLLMDISNVNVNRNAIPCMCYGKTFRGRRCKLKSRNTYKCYGLELAVCKYHDHQNAVYRWSLSKKNSCIPEKIRNFLTFYSHCVTLGINHWLALVITGEVYTLIGHVSKDEIIDLFQTIIFKPASGECSVCYDSPEIVLKTRCGHIFCKSCLSQWTATNITCPMCRKIISQE
jgi:hypothetical protein